MLLSCYGSYGIREAVAFDPELLQLLDGCWLLAVAHVRGGGWLGRRWAEAGRGLGKPTGVADLAAVAGFVKQAGLCSSLCLQGSSAGGWLAASLLLQQPGWFAAAVLTVPCLDPLGLLLHKGDGALELGPAAADAQVYSSNASWAPYDLLEQMLYPDPEPQQQQQQQQHQQQQLLSLPHVLIRAALHDVEVPIDNPVKVLARMRRLSSVNNQEQRQQQQQQPLLLLRVLPGGHLAFEQDTKESAFKLAFLQEAVNEGHRPSSGH
ncbi:hypothetical protein OEZ86_001426 [Tetradesmus obliquus]|nr:hypothetical protein OEZ86_001426 [Tetradesmus obliquus]